MPDVRWIRHEQVRQVRDLIWQHLSPAAVPTAEVLPLAATLLQLPRADQRYLAAVHLLLSPQTAALLDSAPGLLRRLTSSSATVLDEHPEMVRGPVDWPATRAMASVRGVRVGYVTRPTERILSTPENRLLVASLRAVTVAHAALGWDSVTAGVGATVTRLATAATRLQASPVLRSVPAQPETRDLWRVQHGRASRRFEPVVNFWRLHQQLLALEDRNILRDMVQSSALLAAEDGALLELVVFFSVLAEFQRRGWDRGRPRLVHGQAQVPLRLGGDALTLHLQGTPRDMSATYGSLLSQHGFGRSTLRPDLVLDYHPNEGARRLVVVEVKLRQRAAAGARAALFDSLAYRETYRAVGAVHVGTFWGAGVDARSGADVLLCSVDRLPDTLLSVVGGRA